MRKGTFIQKIVLELVNHMGRKKPLLNTIHEQLNEYKDKPFFFSTFRSKHGRKSW